MASHSFRLAKHSLDLPSSVLRTHAGVSASTCTDFVVVIFADDGVMLRDRQVVHRIFQFADGAIRDVASEQANLTGALYRSD